METILTNLLDRNAFSVSGAVVSGEVYEYPATVFCMITQPLPTPTAGHKYYGRVDQKVPAGTTFGDGRFEYFGGDETGKNIVFTSFMLATMDNEWHTYSDILSFPYISGENWTLRSFTVSGSNTVYRRKHMIIDLTECFGAGNEPSKNWCDENIPYFEGTIGIVSAASGYVGINGLSRSIVGGYVGVETHEQGDYIETINASESAYPDNGEQDGFWWVKQAYIVISSESSMVSVTVNGVPATGSGAEWYYNCPSLGEYHIEASDGIADYEENIIVAELKRYDIAAQFVHADPIFANNTWETISNISRQGLASSLWNIGDSKKVIIGGVEHDLIIIGFDHDTPSNITQYGREKIGITMQIGIPGDASKQSIYSKGSVGSGTNNGGWEISNARNNTMSTIYNAIDNSLKPYIAEKETIFAPYYDQQVLSSCTDKLFLASEYEVVGHVGKSPIAEGSLYEFYANSGSRVRYDAGKATYWWLRSVANDGDTRYCAVSTAGGVVVNTFTKSQGFSPLLCI